MRKLRGVFDRLLGREGGPSAELTDRVSDAVEFKCTVQHPAWREVQNYYVPDYQHSVVEDAITRPELKGCATATNLIFPTVETWVTMMLQAMPSPFVVGMDGEDAREVTEYLQAWEDAQGISEEVQKALRNVAIIGTGAMKVYWDPKAEDVRRRSVDPWSIFPEPGAKSLHADNCTFVALRHVFSRSYVEHRWDRVKLDRPEPYAGDKTELESPTALDLWKTNVKDLLVVWEVWDSFGEEYAIYTGKTWLQKPVENPTPGQQFPIGLYRARPNDYDLWGQPWIPYVKDIQDEINRLHSRMSIHSKFAAAPVYWSDDQMITDQDVTPGTIVKMKTPGTKLGSLSHEQLGPEVMNAMLKLQQDFDTISGIQAVLQGMRPKGSTSGIMIQSLVERADMRATGQAQSMTYVHQAMSQLELELMQQNYTGTRSVAVGTRSDPRMVTINQDQLSAVPPEMEGETEAPPPEPRDLRVVMDVRADLPRSQQARFQEAQLLAPLGLSLATIMDVLKWPGREQEAAYQAAKAQMAGAGMQAGQQQGQEQAAQQGAMQQLMQAVGPEGMAMLDAVKNGQAPLESLQPLLQNLPQEAGPLVAAYLQAGQGAP